MIFTAKQIFEIFIHRKDVFSTQQKSGAYFPTKRPITLEDIQKHLDGKITIGAYCLDIDNTVKWACVDIDGDKTLTPEQNKKKEYPKSVAIYNLFPDFGRILEWSGRKGYHVWIIFDKSTLASFAQKLVLARLNRIKMGHHELFPKQVTLNINRKYGNLVKIPNSIHKITGLRSEIIKMEGVI